MKSLNIIVVALIVAILAACSSTPDNNELVESKVFDYKAPPVKARPLDVPPDLTTYVGDDRYGIPGETDASQSYLEYAKGGSGRRDTKVLPPAKNVRLERKENQRWIVINDKAENVWPVIKEFWLENGLVIKIDNPQAGILETDWSENRAKIPMDGVRKWLGKVLDGLFSSGERDQYHTRIERSKDGNSTEIYIAHYGMQEVADKNETGFRWIARPNDPEMEATMLQLLMTKLAGGSGLLDNSKVTSASSVSGTKNIPKLNKLADGSQSILIAEPFDQSWRKVGLALEQARIALADKDRSKGTYFLSAGKDDMKNKLGSDNVVRMQVIVREVNSGCEVTVNNGASASNADTQKIIEVLYKALERI
jgi:outer membrane protein assembly factor BamC